MPDYKAPIRDQLFVLHELLQITTQDVPGYSDLDPAFTEAILSEAGRIASDSLAPLNPVGDREGCLLDAGIVRTPTGFRQAFDSLRKGGWTAMDCDPAYGGQGLPYVIHTAAQEPFCSANMAFTMYHGLTHGAYSAIHTHGTPAQKAKFLPKLVSCDWTGTMNLTEPHAGTDLGLMRTKALPRPDGSYAISGTKIFISAGDHDMAENIIHLVLAKIPDGPEGIKGISLFIVPKVSVNDDGSLGAANGLTTVKLEEKMGIHGNATCELHFAQATGFLLGEAHKGMRAMFTMMNEARMGVGVQGYAQAEGAYQAARAYAQDRLQGRDITGPRNPAGAADPIIHHPDIRRALLDQKSFVEGARALTYWGATLLDRARRMQDAQADALLSLLTPVIKGFLTDMGFQSTVQAQQVFGGHGYIEDSGLSQFVRDARITMIYEGTNGVQALDLVGRKLALGGGKAIMAYLALIAEATGAVAEDPALAAAFGTPLQTAAQDLQKAALYFMDHAAKDPNAALAGATDFLHLMGHASLGLMWLRMAKAASAALAAGRGDAAFLRAKIATGRYYMARQLPMTATHLARITSGADPVMGMDPVDF